MANVFTDDPRIVAVYNFEDGAFGEDSFGTDDLTWTGGASNSSYEKQGSYCAYMDGDADYAVRADAGLTSGFPFKYGTTNKKITFCGWVRPLTINAKHVIIAKNRVADGYRCIQLRIDTDGGVELLVSINSTTGLQTYTHATVLPAADEWYHFQVWYDDAGGSGGNTFCRIRIYRDGVGYLGSTYESESANHLYALNQIEFSIGSLGYTHGDYMYGYFDEFVIANDLLSIDEADLIRQGNYTYSGSSTSSSSSSCSSSFSSSCSSSCFSSSSCSSSFSSSSSSFSSSCSSSCSSSSSFSSSSSSYSSSCSSSSFSSCSSSFSSSCSSSSSFSSSSSSCSSSFSSSSSSFSNSCSSSSSFSSSCSSSSFSLSCSSSSSFSSSSSSFSSSSSSSSSSGVACPISCGSCSPQYLLTIYDMSGICEGACTDINNSYILQRNLDTCVWEYSSGDIAITLSCTGYSWVLSVTRNSVLVASWTAANLDGCPRIGRSA